MTARKAAPAPPTVEMKTCPCGTAFPVERAPIRNGGGGGNASTRKLCDRCRATPAKDRAWMARPEIPPDARRCVDCTALVGIQFGTVSGLDAAGRCHSCAKSAKWRAGRSAEARRGIRRVGGLTFAPPPSRMPLSAFLSPNLRGQALDPTPDTPTPEIAAPRVLAPLPDGWGEGVSPTVAVLVGALRERPDILQRWADGPAGIMAEHGFTEGEVKARMRTGDVVACRVELAAYWRERDGLPLAEIGARLGGRHYTTIMPLLASWELAREIAEGRRDPTAEVRPVSPSLELSAAGAAKRLCMSIGTLRYLLEEGRIRGWKDDKGRWRIRAGDLPASAADARICGARVA